MDGLLKTTERKEVEEEFSLKNLFVPLTTLKAIHWFFVVGISLYFLSLFNNFVGDDSSQIISSSAIHSLINFFWGSTFYNGGNSLIGYYYKPLLSTYYAIIYSFAGQSPFIYHFLQINLHIVNTIILYVIFKKFFHNKIAFLLSLLFLVHPINSETVLYISDAQDILFFLFGILGLFFTIIVKSQKQALLIGLCFLLSLFSKETGILFILMSISYTILFRRKFLLSLIIYSFVVSTIYILLRVRGIGLFQNPLVAPIDRLNLLERLLNGPSIFLFYLTHIIFPFTLSSSYLWAYTNFGLVNFIIPLVIDIIFLIGIFYSGLLLYKKSYERQFKIFIFFSLWFLIGIIFHLQIVPLDATVADRWFYFPLVGALGMIGIFLTQIKFDMSKKWSVIGVLVILLLLSGRTLLRSFDWQNDQTLVSHDIQITPDSYELENILGSDLIDHGKLIEAKKHIEKSIQLYPYLTNYLNLGVIEMRLGNYKAAEKADIAALRYGDYYVVYDNLAELSLVTGDPVKNIVFIKNALKKYPYDGKLWLYLAILDYKTGQKDEARIAVQRAYYYGGGQGTYYIYDTIMNDRPLKLHLST